MTAFAHTIMTQRPLPGPWPIQTSERYAPDRRRRPGPADREKRRRSHAFGIQAENAASQFLHAGGYEIIGRRRRVGSVEIDLIATRDQTLAFVEVKGRRSGLAGYYAVDTRKKARMTTAAETWLSEHPEHHWYAIRFDVAVVWPGGILDYIENAFEAVTLQEFAW